MNLETKKLIDGFFAKLTKQIAGRRKTRRKRQQPSVNDVIERAKARLANLGLVCKIVHFKKLASLLKDTGLKDGPYVMTHTIYPTYVPTLNVNFYCHWPLHSVYKKNPRCTPLIRFQFGVH